MSKSRAWKFCIPDSLGFRVFTTVFPRPVTEREARAFVRDQFSYVRLPKGTTVVQSGDSNSIPARPD